MAMTPSQLSIIVKSDGINTAVSNLNNLQLSAKNAETAVTSLSTAARGIGSGMNTRGLLGQLASLGAGVNSLINTFNSLTNASSASVANLTNSLAAAISRIQALETAVRQANAELARLNGGLGDADRSFTRAGSSGNIFNNTLRSMATAAIAYLGINFAAGIIKEADSWSMMQSKLKLATGSMEGAKVAQRDLFEMSQRLRVPLEDTAKLFTRMSVPLLKMGQNTSDVKKVVESFSMALKLGGATGQEASSAMLQLSQSFNAGRLNGGEFNSVAEAAPSVLRAMEVELVRVGKGADLARYGLKELGAKGIITTQIMSEALKRAAPKWTEEFNQLPLTFDGAMTRIKNAWQKAVGEVGGDTKFNQRLAESLKKIEDMLPSIAKAVGNAFMFMVENAEKIIEALKVLAATIVLVKLGAFITLLWEARAAFIAAETATLGFAAALKLLHLTPAGLALLAVAAAGVALYNAFKDYNKETDRTIENNAKLAQNDDLLKAMEAETLELKKQADASRIKAGFSAIYSEDIKRSTKEYSEEEKAVQEVRLAKDKLQETQMKINAMNSRMGMEDLNKPSTEPMRKELESAVALVKSAEAQIERVKNKSVENDNMRSRDAVFRFGNERNALIENARVAVLTKNQIALEAKKKAEALLEEDIAKYDLKSNEQGLIAINNRKLRIERDYQEALDKIKTPKSEKEVANKIKEEAEANEKLKQELIAVNAQKSLTLMLGKDADKLLPAEKELIKMESEKASARNLSVQRQIVASALETKAIEDKFAAQNKAEDLAKKSISSAQEELDKNEALLKSDEKRVEVLAELAAANQLKIARSLSSATSTQTEIELAYELYEILKKNAGVVGAKVDKDNSSKQVEEAKKRLDDLFNTSRVDKFESASTKALKGVVKGFSELNKALSTYGTKQEKISQARRDNLEVNYGDFKKFSEQEAAITNKEVDYKLASYADIAEAAKNFFNEGSKGYQAMDAVSKVYHAAQMARNLTEMAMMATKGVMNQATGDVYTAIPRMAAMAAIMAGLGFATGAFGSSGGGGAKAADVQKTQGSGSVFGDTEAKSESIKKSLDLLKTSFDRLYPVNQGMLKALKNIESSMTGLTNLVVRSGGIVEGTNMGIREGQLNAKGSPTDFISGTLTKVTTALLPFIGGSVAKFMNNLWGKTTQNIVDSGLQFGGSLSSMKQGQGFNQYASVDTTKSSWFGLSKKTSNSVQTQGLSEELNSQFAMIFTNMQKSLEEAGKVLYGSSKGVTQALENMVFEVSKVSLKGLTGQALTDAINGVISKALDQMAGTAFTNLEQFRQVGEGYAQTVIRVANSFSLVNATFDKLGMKLYAMDDAGIKAAMSFTELFDSMEEMQSVASDYYDKFYTEQEKQEKIVDALKKQFTAMNEVLPDSIKAYRELVDNTTDPAKIATLWKLSGAFSEVFGTMESAAKDIPQKMKDAFESLSNDAQRWLSIRNQAASLKDEINVAMGNPKKDPAIRMQQLWDAMSKDVTPEQKLQLAGELKDLMLQKYQVEKDSLTRLIDFGKQLRGYVDSLKVGSLSPLTTGQKLSEAQAQYQATFAKAQGGDVAAQGMLQGKADAYLQLAQTALASSGQYSAIFSEVTNGLDSLGIESMSAAEQANQTATEQLAELQRLSDFVGSVEVTANIYYNSSLTALASQITLMDAMYQKMGIFDGMLSSISGLPAEIAAALSGKVGSSFGNDEFIRNLYQSVEGRVGNQIDPEGYNYWMKDLMTSTKEQVANNFVMASQENNVNRTSNNTSNLEAQVAALTAEVKGLREDQNMQTGALIANQAITTEASTAAIVTATKESVINESWQNSLKPELV